MIKDIIWDFDGTLFDTYPAIADVFLETFRHFEIIEERRTVLFLLHQSLSETYDFFSKKHNLDKEKLKSEFVKTEEAMDVTKALPFESASILLQTIIDRGGNNFIYTNRGASTYSFLKHAQYTKYFTEIVTREDGYGRKPSPDCINYFIEKYSLFPETILMVGDREIDILAAHNAKIQSCYFNSHNMPISISPGITIKSLIELLPYIVNNN